jgi:hypothetical protein
MLNKQKLHFITFTKSENKRVEVVLPGKRVVISGGKEMGKGYGKVNIVQILCTHVCKWKIDTCGRYSRSGGGGIKENDGVSEFNYDIFNIL